jgi:hypothetical protein
MRWTTEHNWGGIVRLFVNIDDHEEDGTETLEFNDADGLRLYFQDCDDDKLLSQWSIEK